MPPIEDACDEISPGAADVFRARRWTAARSWLVALALPWAAFAADPPARQPPALQYQEQEASRLLYYEESGGLVSTIPPPKGPGSQKREPIPPPTAAKPAAGAGKSTAAPAARKESREARATPVAPQPARVVRRAISCEQPEEAWAAADALVSEGKPEGARVLLETFAAGCPSDAVRLSALEKARPLLDATAFERWLDRETPHARGVDAERRLQRLTYVHVRARAMAVQGTPAKRAAALADGAGPWVVKFRDTPVALSLAWLWLEAGDAASAALWFDRTLAWAPGLVDATRGRALAALAESDFARALALAGELPSSEPQRATLRRDALLGLAERAYRAERFAEVLERLEGGEREGELPRYARALQAWSHMALGERRAAGEIFTALYRETPDLESAQGIAAAVQHDDAAVDASLAATEPLASLLRKRRAAHAFSQSRFIEARAQDSEQFGGVGGVSAPQAQAALSWRDKSGQAGLSQLKIRAATAVAVSTRLGEAMTLQARVDHMSLDAGIPDAGALIGSASPQAGVGRRPKATQADAREERLDLRFEREIAVHASVGRSPFRGALPARTNLLLEVLSAPDWGQVSLAMSALPVRESILSYSGMADPDGSSPWGRVVRHAIEVRALWLTHAPWSAGARASFARLGGERVQDNRYGGAEVSVGRDLGLAGFSYAAVSVGAGMESYERNLSHFTIGQGGYFSPQRYCRLGAALDFMTRENRAWMVRGRMSGGWVHKREDPAPVLPLAPDGRVYAGALDNGHEAAAQLAGVAQVSPNVQVGFALSRSVSPQYSERQALLMVRILFESRRSVVSADIPALGT